MTQKEVVTFKGLGGQLRYKCPDCGFDTYGMPELTKHWVKSHRQTAAPQGPTLFDANDNPIERTIDVPDAMRDFSTSPTRRRSDNEEF